MKIYRGEYYDVGADPVTNGDAQVIHRIDIIDNPYNIEVTSEVVGLNIVYTFTFDPLPSDTTGVALGYSSDGGMTWGSQTGGITSPRTLTLPFSGYELIFTIQRSSGNETYSMEDEVIPIEMAEDPVKDIVIDNDEDKFTAIRARQLEINLHTSSDININTFAQGNDQSFRTNYYKDSVLQFTGFLAMGDFQQEFLPDPNILTLTAIDGIGFLADIPLTDFDGDNPEDEHIILKYFMWALSKTGLKLNIAVCFNIREVTAGSLNGDTTGSSHFFTYNFLDAKTFEDEVSTCINCFDVISAILGEEATLSQYLGEWRITRIDEMEYGIDETVYRWDWNGVFISKATEVIETEVGVAGSHSWMNDDAIVLKSQPVKEIQLEFKYNLPKELPCNVDFERGELMVVISPTETAYVLDCWEKLWSNTTTDDPQTTGIYIKRAFTNDYETDRYVVLQANAGRFTFIKSSRIYVNAKDKFDLSVSRRIANDIGGSGFYRDNHVQARLYGFDGTFWTHHGANSADESTYWEACTSTFRTNQHFYSIEGDASEDQTAAKGLYSGATAEIPTPGYIQILIYRSSLYGTTEDTYVDRMSIDLLMYINGSYQKYTGHEFKVAQVLRNRNVRQKEVFIANAPNRNIKGALLIDNGTYKVLAGLFYNAAQEPDGVVNSKPYGEIQAYDVYNQYNTAFSSFDGDLDHSDPPPSLVTKYWLSDLNDNTNGRLFLLLHYEHDTHLCQWTAFLSEVSNQNVPKQYTGLTFKYLTK